MQAAASGMFDHLSFELVERLLASSEVERYIESQREVQRLMLMNQVGKMW